MRFHWDNTKARNNISKHGVAFEEASTVFADDLALLIPDPTHSDHEEDFVLLGMSCALRLLVVVHTEYEDEIRVISARKATRKERKDYEQEN